MVIAITTANDHADRTDDQAAQGGERVELGARHAEGTQRRDFDGIDIGRLPDRSR